MGNLFQVTDPRGIIVTCSIEQWNEHITPTKQIMIGNEQAVQNSLVLPDVIYGSDECPNRDVYFKHDSGATYSSKLYTKVVVEICGNQGTVITSFPKEDISGNINLKELKYVKPKL